MKAFDDWYFHKTKEKGKKTKVGGRERLINKWEAQTGTNKAVSMVVKIIVNCYLNSQTHTGCIIPGAQWQCHVHEGPTLIKGPKRASREEDTS
jgi:hypothetical protein